MREDLLPMILGADIPADNTVTVTTIVVAAFVQITLAILAFFSAQRANEKADRAAIKAEEIKVQNSEQAKVIAQVKDTVVITEGLVNSRSSKQDAKIGELEAMVRQLEAAAQDRRAIDKKGSQK